MRPSTHTARSVRIVAAVALAFSSSAELVSAQSPMKVRKTYEEELVVEPAAIVVSLPQAASRARTVSDGRPGFYSWRIDVGNGPGLSIVLAADTMMRVANLAQIVAGSSIRRCDDATIRSTRSCKTVLRDTAGVVNNFVQMILRDRETVSYFRQVRPATVRVTTFDPHGRFRIDRYRIRYRMVADN